MTQAAARTDKILVVDDDARIRDLLRRYLTQEGFEVILAEDGKALNRLMLRETADLIVLDLMMPGEDGLSICRRLRAANDRTPIIMLTAKGEDVDRIVGLEVGADDYLGKPFNLGEVEARLRALARRAAGSDDQVNVGKLSLDRQARRFQLDGQPLKLPAREFDVLWELMTPAGRVCSKRDLSAKLSDFDDLLADNALEAFISRLRKKLAGSGAQIRTLRGLGYVLEPEA
jgi:DNA-binding response OmpR family regulator